MNAERDGLSRLILTGAVLGQGWPVAQKGADEEEKEDAKKKRKEEGGDVSAVINAKRGRWV